MTTNGEISVTPPDSLIKFDAPLFAGIEKKNVNGTLGV
jgi:hypothetical protein